MKFILTGATGFIGGEVLRQCLASPSVTSIVVLSRRNLPTASSNPKLKVIIMEDFTVYPDSVIKELAGAEACIWSLGVLPSKTSSDTFKVSVDYVMAAAEVITTHLAPQLSAPFRFLYLSGSASERDQEKKLWVMEKPRKIKGMVETKLFEHEAQHKDAFRPYIIKAGLVSGIGGTRDVIATLIKPVLATVRVAALGAAMIDIASKQGDTQVIEGSALGPIGEAVLLAQTQR